MGAEFLMGAEYRCPECGAETNWRPECPGYPSERGVMVCYPPCGDAIEFFCTNRECSWWHRSPNNRDATKMGCAPTWLDKALAEFEPDEDERI